MSCATTRHASARCSWPPPTGPQVPLTQLAEVGFSAGAPVIKSENGQLVGTVFIDVRDRDVGSYVAEARRRVDEEIVLPAGYRLE